MVYYDRVYVFIQLMYNKNDHLAKQSIFVRCLRSSLASTTPPPPLDPRRSLHILSTKSRGYWDIKRSRNYNTNVSHK